jgi:ketopantoate hydroxymethyltransferase
VKQYAHLGETMMEAARQYISEVKDGRFPEKQRPAIAIGANGKE